MARFDLNQVILAVNFMPIRGFQDGDSIEIEFAEEVNKKRIGADGEFLFSRGNDNSGTIKINLAYQSLANLVLQAVLIGDLEVPITVVDTNGAFGMNAWNCVIAKRPNQTFGVEPSEPSYEFHAAEILMLHSGITLE